MGIILGKFRKKKSALEILEKVDKEIKAIEEFRRDTEQTQKRIVGRFVVISVGAYLLTASIFYFYFFPADFYDQLFYIIPLIFAPVIILTVKRGLTMYYKSKISRKQKKLYDLREEQKKLLDQVKETETYKVVKSILDKYAPENPAPLRRSVLPRDNSKIIHMRETPKPPDTVLRQRALPPAESSFVTPFRPDMTSKPTGIFNTAVPSTPLPRGILPRERSVLDKMVDYLIGDGPSNRFALICKSCSSHNGMAHKDEFEYVSFRCCYCFTMNEARKKRPDGPKLDFDIKSPSSQTQTESSESEKTSPSESESEPDQNRKSPQIVEVTQEESQTDVEKTEIGVTAVEEIINDLAPVGTSLTEEVEQQEPPLIDLKD